MSDRHTYLALTVLATAMLSSSAVQAAEWWYRDLTGTTTVAVEGRGMGLHNISPRRVGVSRLTEGGNLRAWWGTPDDDVSERVIDHYQSLGFPASLDHDDVVACWLADRTDRIVGRIHVSLTEDHTRKQWRSWICSTPELGFPVRVSDLGELSDMIGLSMQGINNERLAAGTIQLRRSSIYRQTRSAVVGGLEYPSERRRDLLLLPSLGNSWAYAVSNPGWVVGSSAFPLRKSMRACYWGQIDGGWTQTLLDFSSNVNPRYLDRCLDNPDSRSAAYGVASEYDGDSGEYNHVIAGYCSNRQRYDDVPEEFISWLRPVLWIYGGNTLTCIIDPAAEMHRAAFYYEDPHSMGPLEGPLESVHGVFLDANAHWYGVGWVKTGSFSNPDPSETDRPDDDEQDDLTNKRAIRLTVPNACAMSSGIGKIQGYDTLFYADTPWERVDESERTLLTAVAINDDFQILGSAQHGNAGPIHAYMIWPVNQDDLDPPGCGPECTPLMWTPGSAEPEEWDPALRSAHFGSKFLIGTRKAHGKQPRDPRTQRLSANNVVVLEGDGAVVDQLSSPDFKEDLRFLVAGKSGDWAVGYWNRRLHLVGDPEAVGAQQGFNASDNCTMRIVWNRKTGRARATDLAATRQGIIALAEDGTVHVFGTAAGASPGKPRVFQSKELGLQPGTTIVEVKGFPASEAWAFLDSNGVVHLKGAAIANRTSFPAHGGFLPGYGAKSLITVAPIPADKHGA